MANSLLEAIARSVRGSDEFDKQLESSLQAFEAATSMTDLKALVASVVAVTEQVRDANNLFQQQIESANQEIEALRSRLEETERHAHIDELTQVYNRRSFDRQLTQLLETDSVAQRVCLILIDIDHFKQFNDEYGHIIGDRVLRRIGELLHDHCPDNAISARFGGEEFAVILTNATVDDAAQVADRLRQRIHALRVKTKNSNRVLDNISASFGVANYQPGESIEQFIDRADQGLYAAKQQGRNRVEIFSST